MTKKKRTFLHSLNNAVDGFLHVLKHERNMRIHFFIGFSVLVLGIFLGVNRLEWIILCACVSLVLVTEMINTVIEEMVDMIETEIHPTARIIKDAAAGAVLVSAFNALVVGFFIFARYWQWPLEVVVFRLRHMPWHVTFIALMVVIFLVIVGKAFFRRGTPFRGGAISGHAAVAFSLWTTVLFMVNNVFVILVTLLLALLVAQSRLRAKIHSLEEIGAGAAVGTLVTAIFFQLFR